MNNKILAFTLLTALTSSIVTGQTNDDAARLRQHAEHLAKSGQLAPALEALSEALKRFPDNDGLLAFASHLERTTGKYSAGLAHALHAIKVNPRVPWYYASAAHNAHGLGEFVIAKEHANKFLAMGNKDGGNYKAMKALLATLAEKSYRVIWTLDPKLCEPKNGGYEIPLPTFDVPYQTGEYEVVGAKSHRPLKRDGNDLLFVVPDEERPFVLLAHITILPYSFSSLLKEAHAEELPNEVKPFLGKSEGIDPKNETVVGVARQLKGDSEIESVRNILTWMNKNLKYNTERIHSAETVIQKGHGECGGWAMAFSALCRSIGIPAREVWGVTQLRDPEKPLPTGFLKGHAWAEFYVQGCGWIPVDPGVPDSLMIAPHNYIRMHHYDVNYFTWRESKLRPYVTMFRLGGDNPRFTPLQAQRRLSNR